MRFTDQVKFKNPTYIILFMLSEENEEFLEALRDWVKREETNINLLEKYAKASRDRMEHVMVTGGMLANLQQEVDILQKWLYYPYVVTTLGDEEAKQVLSMVKDALIQIMKARILIAQATINKLPKATQGEVAFMNLFAEPALAKTGGAQ